MDYFTKIKNLELVHKKGRKIKYIYDFRNKVIGGTVRLGYRRINLRGNLQANFPFKNNSVCRLVGKTPDYVGMITGSVVDRRKSNLSVLSKIIKDSKYDEIKRIYNDEMINYREVLSPGYNTGIEQIKNYTNESNILRDLDEMLEIVQMSNFKWFKIPELDEPDDKEMYTINFKPDASPGHYTKNIIAKKRSGSVRYTSQVADDIYELLKTTAVKNFYLWEILGREKDVKIIEGDDVSSRIVMNTEEPMVLLLSMFSQRLTKSIQNDDSNTILIGKDLKGNTSKLIKLAQNRRTWTIETDWRKFDSNIQKNDVILAGSILLSNINLFSKRMRRSMYLIISSIITKYVAINPGFVLRIDKGVPSGHPFTSLITSVINLIYWCLIGYKIYGRNYVQYMDVFVQGDDANVMMDDHPNLLKIDSIIRDLGIESEPLKGCFIYNKYVKSLDEEPILLKRRFNHEGIIWNRKSIIRKIIYQTSKTKTIEDDIAILRNYVLTAPFDELMNELLSEMIHVHVQKLNISEYDKKGIIDDIEKSILAKKEEFYILDKVKSGLNFERGVIDKPDSIDTFHKNKWVKLERGKYLFSLFSLFPGNMIQRNKSRLDKIVKSRDLIYLNEFIGTGVPPPVKYKIGSALYYRFGYP